MEVGVPREIKDHEYRVALTPDGARALYERGHAVYVQRGAGTGSGFADAQYESAGATLCEHERVWAAELVLKVKEPLPPEYPLLDRQILFTYLHLSGVPRELTEALLARKVTAVAYETVEDGDGALPLLAPMSAIAGNMAAVVGSYYLARFNGGRGTQLGSVLGASSGRVVVIGDGVVGQHAARTAAAMGASVVICGLRPDREAQLRRAISPALRFVQSEPDRVAQEVSQADLVVGAVLLRGARATHAVTEPMVEAMVDGSVIVDVSIDQGGCVETSHPTSHSNPVFTRHGVIHYCVTNMPGAYPRTATIALTRATLPYALELARAGVEALRSDPAFAKGVNTHAGEVCFEAVARALGLVDRYRPFAAAGAPGR